MYSISEAVLLTVFSISAVFNLLRYLVSCLYTSQVELSYIQKKLLGVKESGEIIFIQNKTSTNMLELIHLLMIETSY